VGLASFPYTGRQYCAVDSITTSPTACARSQASQCWISALVVPNLRFSYWTCSPEHRRIATASIFLCTSIPATERYTDSMLVSW
jgi:hypothetical protein